MKSHRCLNCGEGTRKIRFCSEDCRIDYLPKCANCNDPLRDNKKSQSIFCKKCRGEITLNNTKVLAKSNIIFKTSGCEPKYSR